jgi:hypothetical protein
MSFRLFLIKVVKAKLKNKTINIIKPISPLILVFLFLIVSCTPYYIAANFNSRTAHHTKVAVLPFEILFIGRMPADLTEEDILEIEEAEAIVFQVSFYNEILRSTKNGRKPIGVDLQHYDETLDLLNKNNIGIRQSWRTNPKDLAAILGVDAVVKASIEKTRFMSDLASFGIEHGIRFFNDLTDYRLWPLALFVNTTSKKVKSSYYLLDKEDATAIWSIAYDIDADWRSPTDEIINHIIRRSARKFPYRIGK